MPYLPIIPEASDRRALGIVPVELTNVMIEPQPQGVQGRSKYVAVPTPGRTRRAELPGFVRGLFCKPGVQGGGLFAAAGTAVHSISTAWATASLGTIAGADTATFVDFRDDFAVRAGGSLYLWDGSSFLTVNDADAPNPAQSLASAAYRLIASELNGDGFGWSKAGQYNDWDPLGVAASFELPDPVVGQAQQGGDLVSFGARSIQRWRPTGGIESEAFSPVQSGLQNMGLAGRDLVTELDGGLAFVNDRGQPAWIGGGVPQVWEHRAFSDWFNGLNTSVREGALGWGYQEGDAAFYGVRAFNEAKTYVYDRSLRLWHRRERYGATSYDVGYVQRAFDTIVCAGPESPYVWELSRQVYTDDGDPIVRTMTVRVDMQSDVAIRSLSLDIRAVNQPLTGTGSAPVAMLTYSRDGGQTWSDEWGDVREMALPPAGTFDARPTEWQFGLFTRAYGAMFRIQISDPIGFAVQGIWLDEGFR